MLIVIKVIINSKSKMRCNYNWNSIRLYFKKLALKAHCNKYYAGKLYMKFLSFMFFIDNVYSKIYFNNNND